MASSSSTGPGSPRQNQQMAEAQVREHQRLHKGEPGKVVTQGPPKVTYPQAPPARPDDARTAMPVDGSPYDPAREAQRG